MDINDKDTHKSTIEELKQRNEILKTRRIEKKVEPEKRKSAMQIICEWTQLVNQQNYLESTQLKLKREDFIECEDLTTDDFKKGSPKSISRQKWSSSKPSTASQITDINNLKEFIAEDLKMYHIKSRNKIEDFRLLVNNLKDDVFQEDRLRNISLPSTRSRIISINSKLEQLKVDNEEELNVLKEEELELEAELKQELKPFTYLNFGTS